jgi:hypothetical protein
MQGGEAELLEADRQPKQLPRPPLDLHLEAGMALHHRRLDAGSGRLSLDPVAGSMGGCRSGILWEAEESCKWERVAVISLAAALLNLKGLQDMLKFPHVVDCSPNYRCLIALKHIIYKKMKAKRMLGYNKNSN